jgi:hypothetical protein
MNLKIRAFGEVFPPSVDILLNPYHSSVLNNVIVNQIQELSRLLLGQDS